MDIGREINKLRLEKGLTLKQLYERTGISISFISDIEHGRRNPGLDNLEKLAKGLDVSPNDLFRGIELESGTGKTGHSLNKLVANSLNSSENILVVTSEVEELLETLHKRPEMKALFSISKNSSKEDIEKAIKIIEALKDDK